MRLIDPAKDYSAAAARCITVLGVLCLLSLNFGGLLCLWLASGIRARRPGHRKWTMRLLAVQFGLTVMLLTAAASIGTDGVEMQLLSWKWEAPPLWSVLLFGGFCAAIHVPILLWLDAPGTRRKFEKEPRK